MDRSKAQPRSDRVDRTWRRRVATAAAAEIGDGSEATLLACRRTIDRGVGAAFLGLVILGLAGAVAGWTTTAELLAPADAPVHAPLLLAAIVAVPWIVLGLRWAVLVIARRRAPSILGRLVPWLLVRTVGRADAGEANVAPKVGTTTARLVASMLAEGSGRRIAAAGGMLFWTTFGTAAILAIWMSTARVAYGFGWESSWLSPAIGEATTRAVAAPLSMLPAGVDADQLAPVASPPTAAADDPTALELRRSWIRFLVVGVAVYLVLPMGLLTAINAAIGHLQAERWRPRPRVIPTPTVRTPDAPPVSTGEADGPDGSGGRVTHVAVLERPEGAALPAPFSSLEDLGAIDANDDLDRIVAATGDADRLAIVAWLPGTPDRGLRRRLAGMGDRLATSPLVVLDGGDRLRALEPPRTVAIRIDEWRRLLAELGLESIECDLDALTDTTRSRLKAALVGGSSASAPGVDAPLDPARLDAAFAVIGRFLPGSDATTEHLPSDAGTAACLTALAEEFGADGLRTISGRLDLDRIRDAVANAASEPATAIESLRATGLAQLPDALRRSATWAGVGGLLGVAACAAAATVAPVALVAIPGWAGTGAGLAGLVSLARGRANAATVDDASTSEAASLGDVLVDLAATAVLWWSQAGDESTTTRALEALATDDDRPDDAHAARLWLAAARERVVGTMEHGS